MTKPLYSMGTMSAAEAWRDIRSIRAAPTGQLQLMLRDDGLRRNEFHMALEQGQQQFSACKRIGYASRPLNLFYGLSQAGRALAAGSRRLRTEPQQQWQGVGHGMKFNVDVQDGLWNTAVKLQTTDRDLFSRVSIATASPYEFKSVAFGALVNQLVDYTMAFREPENFARPLHDVRVYGASPSFPLEIEVKVPGHVPGIPMTLAEVEAALGDYPALASFGVASESGDVRWSHNAGYCVVVVPRREDLLEESNGTLVLRGSSRYRGSAVLLPRAADHSGPLRPLMVWWLVLYALSMLARYAPSKWMKILSLTQSPIASKVEFLLDTAVDAVPELLVDELVRLQS